MTNRTPRTGPTAEQAPAQARASRRKSEPSSDAEIERGLRERAVSDSRAAEILLRSLQRPRAETSGLRLDEMSGAELEAHACRAFALASSE
jgi:hypothetical protein